MADEFDTNEGLTRREALKKGAILSGALIWAVPAVQTIGIGAAFATTPSEGTCCLRVDIVSIQVGDFTTGSTALDDILVNYKGINCGTETINNVRLTLDQSADGGANWILAVGSSFNLGNVQPGNFTETFQYITDLPSGSYLYRLSGTYKCASGGDVELPHNIPLPYDFGGPAVISP